MGVARAGGGGLVLGLGTTSGQVFLVSIIADNLLWLPLEVADTSGKRRVKWYRNASIPHSVLMPLSAIYIIFSLSRFPFLALYTLLAPHLQSLMAGEETRPTLSGYWLQWWPGGSLENRPQQSRLTVSIECSLSCLYFLLIKVCRQASIFYLNDDVNAVCVSGQSTQWSVDSRTQEMISP